MHLGQDSAPQQLPIVAPYLKEILSAWHGRIPKMFSLRAAFDASNEYYYITERNQKLKCLRVQLIYPNRKCFLKNYSAIFIANLSQTQNRINRICSFKTSFFFFFNHGQKYFLCFHSSANTSPPSPPPPPTLIYAGCMWEPRDLHGWDFYFGGIHTKAHSRAGGKADVKVPSWLGCGLCLFF